MRDYYQFKQGKSQNQIARELVKQSAHIPNFGYHGDLDLGITWAFVFSVANGSDRLERSNWEVISEDLLKRHPKTVEITPCGHWLVGWVDHLTVKMVDKNGQITRAGIDVLDWLEKLDQYPVADEDHYSELECTENYNNALQSIKDETYRVDLADDLPDNWRGLVYEWLSENNPKAIETAEDRSEGWLDQESITEACKALGYLDSEDES